MKILKLLTEFKLKKVSKTETGFQTGSKECMDSSGCDEREEVLENNQSSEDVNFTQDIHRNTKSDKLQELKRKNQSVLIEKLEQNDFLQIDLENASARKLRSNSCINSSESSSLMAYSENFTRDLDSPDYSRPKQSRQETEFIEPTYQTRFDQNKKFKAHLRQMKTKYEANQILFSLELIEDYEQALSKANFEIDQLLEILNNTSKDSSNIINSLKLEMNKMKHQSSKQNNCNFSNKSCQVNKKTIHFNFIK